jgi:outer membrane protein assembly factor BamB
MTFNPVIADGLLYFGSSADNKVYALDAARGREVWNFHTEGPVRVAPAVGKHGVYVGSDDGLLYCLDAKTGECKWSYRAGPEDDRIMGNDRMISRWPVRGGPAVVDDIVYFGAGIWPTEVVYITALDARTGKVIWQNDDSANTARPSPRAGKPKTGPSAQGHLAVGSGIVLVPTGRAAPGAFGIEDGALKYFHYAVYVNKAAGGTKVAILDQFIVYGENWPSVRKTRLAAAADGHVVGATITPAYANHPTMIVVANGAELLGQKKLILESERKDRRGQTYKEKKLPRDQVWKFRAPFEVTEMVISGDRVVVGGSDAIAIIDMAGPKVFTQARVGEKVLSLAVADQRVYASTPSGTIYCFGATGGGREIAQPTQKPSSRSRVLSGAAEEILKKSGISEGYCLDIGCGEGDLAVELARRSKLHVYGVDDDPKNIEAARAKLDELGLLGVRVTVHHVRDLGKLPYNGKFAELVVSSRALSKGSYAVDTKTVERMLCPHLGVACIGKPGALRITRGKPIPNSANWTHFFADAQGSHCGTDKAVRGPLEILWYRDTDYEMANRHSMSSPTMVYNGYMVMPGTHGVRVANVYNGRPIWQYDMPGFNLYPGGFSYERRLLTGNMCVADGKVYVRHQDYCICFDIVSGKILGKWQVPGNDRSRSLWGYIACKDGLLYGSIANTDLAVRGYPGPGTDTEARTKKWLAENPTWNPNHHCPDSKALFAMDAATGEVKWIYKAENSIRSAGIAVGKGMIYFVDKPTSPYDNYSFHLGPRGQLQKDRVQALAEERAGKSGRSVGEELAAMKDPRGPLVALNSETGKVAWKTDAKTGFGKTIAVSLEHDVLVMGDGKLAAFKASNGRKLWEGATSKRLMLYGRSFRSGGTEYNLMTGKSTGKYSNIGGYCAPTLGSPRLLACRSGCISYIDLDEGERRFFAGIRPGCYMDMTPAGGLLVMADGASGCGCSYMNQCTIALQPKE